MARKFINNFWILDFHASLTIEKVLRPQYRSITNSIMSRLVALAAWPSLPVSKEPTGSLQGKPALSMEKACNNHKETLCVLWINPVTFTYCGETP